MENKPTDKKPGMQSDAGESKPGFFRRIVKKLDVAMKEKAEEKSAEGDCCGSGGKGKDGKCC